MSAFIVSKAHIDALVDAAIASQSDRLSWYDTDITGLWGDCGSYEEYSAILASHRHEATIEEVDRIGRMLWGENLKSVQARYPDDASGDRPGPIGLTDDDIESYTHGLFYMRRPLPAVAVLKAINCYEYQSCEHGGWPRSEAKYFCDALKERMIRRLPGYDDAEWEVAA